jgi:hypothetical protein
VQQRWHGHPHYDVAEHGGHTGAGSNMLSDAAAKG